MSGTEAGDKSEDYDSYPGGYNPDTGEYDELNRFDRFELDRSGPGKVQYCLSIGFDDELVRLEPDYASRVRERLAEQFVYNMRREGYPDDAYAIEFSVNRDPYRYMSSMTARTVVDLRKRMPTVVAFDPAEYGPIPSRVDVPIQPKQEEPRPKQDMAKPMVIKRVRITEDE